MNSRQYQNSFDLGWAERDRVSRGCCDDILNGSLFHCEMVAGRDGRAKGKRETFGVIEQCWEYSYDKAGRLVRSCLDGLEIEQYSYDYEGRRSSSKCRVNNNSQVVYTYDSKDRLLAMGDFAFEYDSNGRMISRSHRGYVNVFHYDELGFLDFVDFPGNQQLSYERDGDGLIRRILFNGRVVEEFSWYDALRIRSWSDQSEGRVIEFHYSSRVPHAITVREGGYTYDCALGVDQVGTIKTVADSTGDLIRQIQYDSFGNVLSDSNPQFFLPIGFAGGVHDRHVGLIRFGWRYYMPEAGRFTAPDPARWCGGDPDLCDYCVDNPITQIDPLGLKPQRQRTEASVAGRPSVKIGPNEYELGRAKERARERGKKSFWLVYPKPAACEKCHELAGIIHYEKPERPHPNCKCKFEEVKVDKKRRFSKKIYGTAGGALDHAYHAFSAIGPVTFKARGNGIFFPSGLYFVTNNGNFFLNTVFFMSDEHVLDGDDVMQKWVVHVYMRGADNCRADYTIEYIVEK
ncbi:hypothetical protein JCM16814_30310 [Desulfobaculum senezii]